MISGFKIQESLLLPSKTARTMMKRISPIPGTAFIVFHDVTTLFVASTHIFTLLKNICTKRKASNKTLNGPKEIPGRIRR